MGLMSQHRWEAMRAWPCRVTAEDEGAGDECHCGGQVCRNQCLIGCYVTPGSAARCLSQATKSMLLLSTPSRRAAR